MKDLEQIALNLQTMIKERTGADVVIEISISELPRKVVNASLLDSEVIISNDILGSCLVKNAQVSDTVSIRIQSVYHD